MAITNNFFFINHILIDNAKKGPRGPFLFNVLITVFPSSLAAGAPVVCEPGVVKMTTIEVASVVSFKERTVVVEVETVPVVAVPGRVVIVGISGEIGFANGGSGIIAIRIYRCGRISGTVNNWCGSDNRVGSDVDATGSRNTETEVGTYEYLRIAFSSDEAGGYNGGEDK
jgi:hypothetical protein